MPVFISHRTQDDDLARKVCYHLYSHHDIKCYIDDFDKATEEARETNRITALILERLEYCTHLLALVTKNTKGSWWVPFEVGVARRAPRVISTFTNLYDWDLPEYLKEWPILRSNDALDEYAIIYRTYKNETNQLLLESVQLPNRQESADLIHRRLKIRLNQS